MLQHRAPQQQKFACNDVENATQATLAHFGSVFRLFWG
jgi:hypothetical protein